MPAAAQIFASAVLLGCGIAAVALAHDPHPASRWAVRYLVAIWTCMAAALGSAIFWIWTA